MIILSYFYNLHFFLDLLRQDQSRIDDALIFVTRNYVNRRYVHRSYVTNILFFFFFMQFKSIRCIFIYDLIYVTHLKSLSYHLNFLKPWWLFILSIHLSELGEIQNLALQDELDNVTAGIIELYSASVQFKFWGAEKVRKRTLLHVIYQHTMRKFVNLGHFWRHYYVSLSMVQECRPLSLTHGHNFYDSYLYQRKLHSLIFTAEHEFFLLVVYK